MPFTNDQTAAFFTDNAQMSIPARTVTEMTNEGISVVDDLAEFGKDEFIKNPG